jgi:hypothetical protein
LRLARNGQMRLFRWCKIQAFETLAACRDTECSESYFCIMVPVYICRCWQRCVALQGGEVVGFKRFGINITAVIDVGRP